MGKVSLQGHMQEQVQDVAEDEAVSAGPYITISRQFGCYGFSLGLLLMEIVNEAATPETTWRIYHREILERLASETNVAPEDLDRQRRSKPRLLAEFFRSISKERIPGGYEIRNRTMTIVRDLCVKGHAIIIGQSGAMATLDLPNGLSVRLEAPKEWRVKEVAFREGLSEVQSKLRIQSTEKERDYIRKLYERRLKSKTIFNLTYDCSYFTLTQIAQHVAYAMTLKGQL